MSEANCEAAARPRARAEKSAAPPVLADRQFAMCKAVVMEMWYNVCDFDMCMMDEIAAKRDEIYAIARKHKAEKLWVFGSCARREVAA